MYDFLSLPKLLSQLQELKTLEKKDVVKYLKFVLCRLTMSSYSWKTHVIDLNVSRLIDPFRNYKKATD